MKRFSLSLLFACFATTALFAQNPVGQPNRNDVVKQVSEEFTTEMARFEDLCHLKSWMSVALQPTVNKIIKKQDKAAQKALKSRKEEIAGHVTEEIYPAMADKFCALLDGSLEIENLRKLNAYLENPVGQNLVYVLLKSKNIYIDDLSQYATIPADLKPGQEEFRLTPYGDNLNVLILLWDKLLQQAVASEQTQAAITAAFAK